jgi:sulfur carrier protein
VTVVVNGVSRKVADGATVADLAAELGHHRRPSVAIALNGEIVARSDWARTVLGDGDRVELVGAAQGG